MNLINLLFLRLLLLPNKLYGKIGINTNQLRSILETKLLMDDRRPPSIFAGRQKQKQPKQIKASTLGTMAISLLMGCFFLVVFFLNADIIAKLTFYFLYFLFMLIATLISDFTSVLIDVRDNYIILPKPVNDRTMLMARLLHIFIYICKLVVPMLLPGIIYMIIEYNIIAALLLFFSGLMTVVFSIFVVNAFYIFILRITKPERFKNIISFVQIILAIIVYGSFQLLPRLMGQIENFNFQFSNSHWLIVLPSYWFASLWNVIYHFHGTSLEVTAAAFGIVIPFLSLWVVIKFLAPSFNRKLSLITNTGNDQSPSIRNTIQEAQKTKRSFSESIAALLTKPGAERCGFLFTWKMMARSRDFKMKVYPSIGYFIVYSFIVLFNMKNLNLADIQQQTSKGTIVVISALYFSSFVVLIALTQIIYSEKYKAAWLYFITPIKTPGNVIAGAVKATLVKFFISIMLLFSIAGVILSGISFIPNLLLAAVNQLLICYLLVYLGNKEFPFAKSQSMDAKAGMFLRNLSRIIIPFMIAGLHYFIFSSLPLVILVLLVSFSALWLVMGSVKNFSWSVIRSTYSDE